MSAAADHQLGLFSSSLGSTEARNQFSRRLAEVVTTAFTQNSALDQLQRSAERLGEIRRVTESSAEVALRAAEMATEVQRLRRAFEESRHIFEVAEQASKLSSNLEAINRATAMQTVLKDMQAIDQFRQAHELARTAIDFDELRKQVEDLSRNQQALKVYEEARHISDLVALLKNLGKFPGS